VRFIAAKTLVSNTCARLLGAAHTCQPGIGTDEKSGMDFVDRPRLTHRWFVSPCMHLRP
jgi:hypothetical protein